MIHGVTLNYHTGHTTGRGGSASPKTALLTEKLSFRKSSHRNSLNCSWISKRYHFSVVRQPAVWVGFHQGITISSNAEQSAHFSSQETNRHRHNEMNDEGVC